ncbi:MAG: hypothetical protein ABJD53_09240 [Gammaproteobacteria bacterium]
MGYSLLGAAAFNMPFALDLVTNRSSAGKRVLCFSYVLLSDGEQTLTQGARVVNERYRQQLVKLTIVIIDMEHLTEVIIYTKKNV